MKTIAAAILSCVAVGGAAVAAERGPDAAPDWIEKPTGAQVSSAYPAEARKRSINGMALLRCHLAAEDAPPKACGVLAERPIGYGFGAAALSMAPHFKFSPALKGGRPVEGEIAIPINFSLAQEPPKSPPSAEALNKARRLLTAMGVDRYGEMFTGQVLLTIYADPASETYTTEERAALFAAAQEVGAAQQVQLKQGLAQAYAETFTPHELYLAAAFYESPIGQRIAAEEVRIDSPVAMAMSQQLGEIARATLAKFCEKAPTAKGCVAPGGAN